MIVTNSTVLIFLSKLHKLDWLKLFYRKVLIPQAVYNEVVIEGKKHNHLDYLEVERAISDGWIGVEKIIPLSILMGIGIDQGELEAISLAHKKKCDILLDQDHARAAAQIVHLQPHGTLFILLKALKKKLISYSECMVLLEQLISHGFRIRDDVYVRVIRVAGEIDKKRGI